MSERLHIAATVDAPLQTVWDAFNTPADIEAWNHASDDWMCTDVKNDLRVGGTLSSRMSAKDGSMAFDFGGEYTQVEEGQLLAYRLGDGRGVEVRFTALGPKQTRVEESFDAESTHPAEIQQAGWQAILDNFKAHAEAKAR